MVPQYTLLLLAASRTSAPNAPESMLAHLLALREELGHVVVVSRAHAVRARTARGHVGVESEELLGERALRLEEVHRERREVGGVRSAA